MVGLTVPDHASRLVRQCRRVPRAIVVEAGQRKTRSHVLSCQWVDVAILRGTVSVQLWSVAK